MIFVTSSLIPVLFLYILQSEHDFLSLVHLLSFSQSQLPSSAKPLPGRFDHQMSMKSCLALPKAPQALSAQQSPAPAQGPCSTSRRDGGAVTIS